MDMTLKCQIGGATFLTRNMHDQKKENKNRLEALQGFDCVLSIFRVLDDAGWQHVWFTLSRPPSSCRDRHRHHHHHHHHHQHQHQHQHQHHHPHHHHHFFFPRSFFCNRLLFRLFYWSVSRQMRNTKGKSPGPMQVLTGVEEVDWKGVGRSGLRPGFGSSWDDWLQRCKDLGWLRGWLQRGSWLHVSGWRSSVQ